MAYSKHYKEEDWLGRERHIMYFSRRRDARKFAINLHAEGKVTRYYTVYVNGHKCRATVTWFIDNNN